MPCIADLPIFLSRPIISMLIITRMRRRSSSSREVMFELLDVARLMRTFIDQRAREHAMTRAQWGVLVRLERQEGMTQVEMAEQMEMQPISLLRLIDRLCQQNLVERRPHPSDRRANLLYLTEAGRAVLARMVPVGNAIVADVFDAVAEGEIAALLQSLLRIKGNIRGAALRRDLNGSRAVRHVR
jgi:MarR family transcriptional regulator for hemolysin